MELKLSQILSINGYPGLFREGSRTKGGFVAIALATGKPLHAIDRRMKINNLADITIYTQAGEMRLAHVFQRISAHEAPQPAAKASIAELKDYFRAVIPDYNEKKLFPSDIKHILSWFNELKGRVDFEN